MNKTLLFARVLAYYADYKGIGANMK